MDDPLNPEEDHEESSGPWMEEQWKDILDAWDEAVKKRYNLLSDREDDNGIDSTSTPRRSNNEAIKAEEDLLTHVSGDINEL